LKEGDNLEGGATRSVASEEITHPLYRGLERRGRGGNWQLQEGTVRILSENFGFEMNEPENGGCCLWKSARGNNALAVHIIHGAKQTWP